MSIGDSSMSRRARSLFPFTIRSQPKMPPARLWEQAGERDRRACGAATGGAARRWTSPRRARSLHANVAPALAWIAPRPDGVDHGRSKLGGSARPSTTTLRRMKRPSRDARVPFKAGSREGARDLGLSWASLFKAGFLGRRPANCRARALDG